MNNHYFAYRSFNPEFETMKRFVKCGLDTICFLPGNTNNSLGLPYSKYPPIWCWYDQYNFNSLDEQINDLKKIKEDIKLICIIDLNSPEWLARRMSLWRETGDSFTHLSESLANIHWKEPTLNYLNAFLEYTEKNHSNSIVAYVLACGHTDEWFDHNNELCGLPKAKKYAQWRQDNGLELGKVPPPDSACNTQYDDFLLDPSKSKDVFDYRKFCNELVGTSICEFAKVTKEKIRSEVEVGVFYGYVVDRVEAAESTHLDYERVLACKDIDFLISPGTYVAREMGDGSGWQNCSGSEKLAHKTHMNECDQRTHTYNHYLSPYVSFDVPSWQNTQEDLAGIKREFALTLINQSSLWWFDMWGGFYQEEELFDAFSKMIDIYNKNINLPVQSMEETIMIVDPAASYYIGHMAKPNLQRSLASQTRLKLNKSGIPFECYTFNDIPKIANLDKIKFVVMPCPWEITPEKETMLQKYLLNNNRTILWLYAPGLSDGTSLDESRCQKWIGKKLADAKGLEIHGFDNWNSAFIKHPDKLTPENITQLAQDAGVHVYVNKQIPVFANSRFLSIHCKDADKLTITLPSGFYFNKELFTEKSFDGTPNTITWETNGPETLLFELKQK
jgi:hypothetical protein